jgi:putative FmdB family regulatory protein
MPTYQYRCEKCGKKFERTETISEHETLKMKCPKCGSKKVSLVPGNVYVVPPRRADNSEAWGLDPDNYCIGALYPACRLERRTAFKPATTAEDMQRRTTPMPYRGRKVICYVTRNRVHTARKVRRPVGGYSRLTARRVLWGPAGMPPAPKDFGPHFDFPAHSLNSGPTEAPYPGW